MTPPVPPHRDIGPPDPGGPGAASSFDVVVAGAGPAGFAAAICATQHGRRVALLDPSGATQEKACGEGLLPAGVAALDRMGVRLPAKAVWPLAGVAYQDDRRRIQAAFASDARALGVKRSLLSAALRARAGALGVTVLRQRLLGLALDEAGVRVRTDAGTLRGHFLVGADGLHSRVRRLAGLELPSRPRAVGWPAWWPAWLRPRLARATPPRRFGLRRHYARAPFSPLIEVYLGDGVEAYVTPVAPDCINLAMLTERPATGWDAHLAAFPALVARLEGVPAGAVAGAGPFWRSVRAVAAGRVALVGDAAGYVDAVTGEGVSLALVAAEAWAASLDAPVPAEAYARAIRPARRHYAWHARLLLACLRRRWLLGPALAALTRCPRLVRGWVRAAVALPEPKSR